MYRIASGSVLAGLVLGSVLTHPVGVGGGGGSHTDHEPQATKKDSTTPAYAEADAGKCYPFEVLFRIMGLPEPVAKVNPPPLRSPDLNCTAEALQPISGTLTNASPPVFNGQILIATVPDPLETSDVLEFDRDIAALQEAVSTAGYDFRVMLTPWHVSDLEEPKDIKDSREAEHYRRIFGDQPGAMVFQCSVLYHCPAPKLLLLLVPESPAYGLNIHAANEALAAYHLLKNAVPGMPAEFIHWIGPEYSASAANLGQLPGKDSFCILSGSISIASAEKNLRVINRAHPDCIPTESPTLSALDIDSLLLLLKQPAFRKVGSDQSIAVLSEDETAYGRGIDLSDDNGKGGSAIQQQHTIRPFIFPRGISHIRGLYGNFLRDPGAAASQTADSYRAAVTLNFADALQDPLDTAEEFAAQSPISNESVLASIAASVAHIHASAIVILATDPLDQLFLARYFHRYSPASRLVLFNAERLLPRLRGDFNLDGTIVLTRFPLFQDSYLQAPYANQTRHPLSFTSSSQEGVFLAALAQIWPNPIRQAPVNNEQRAMASWVSVAGAGDFWPLAFPAGIEDTKNPSFVLVDTPDEAFPPLWRFILAVALLGGVAHLLFFILAVPVNAWNRTWKSAAVTQWTRHRFLSFYSIYNALPVDRVDRKSSAPHKPGRILSGGQCWWLMNMTILILLALSYLFIPAIVYRGRMSGASVPCAALSAMISKAPWLTLTALTVAFALATLIIYLGAIYVAEWMRNQHRHPRIPYLPILPPFFSVAWVVAALVLFVRQLSNRDSGWPFSIRCLHLSSGVCPILPLLLATAGLLSICGARLNLFTLCFSRDPGIPNLDWDYLETEDWKRRLSAYTHAWGSLLNPHGLFLIAGFLVGLALLKPWSTFATFDEKSISHLYLLTCATGVWFALSLCVRFLRMWTVLRYGLECLETSPLRFAFSRLPKTFSPGPIWSYAGLRRQVVLPVRWLEYLRVAPEVPAPWKKQTLRISTRRLLLLRNMIRDSQQFNDMQFREFNDALNRYASALARRPWIVAAWSRGGPDLVPNLQKAEQKTGGEKTEVSSKSRPDVPAPCGLQLTEAASCNVVIANEYIATRMAAYIRYITLHLKNLMSFMSAGLLFLVLAAVSYPFNDPNAILWEIASLVGLFLLAIGTVLVQMERDAILSRLSETDTGKLSWGSFLPQLALAGGLPALTVLASVFPTLGNALLGLLRPVLSTLH